MDIYIVQGGVSYQLLFDPPPPGHRVASKTFKDVHRKCGTTTPMLTGDSGIGLAGGAGISHTIGQARKGKYTGLFPISHRLISLT